MRDRRYIQVGLTGCPVPEHRESEDSNAIGLTDNIAVTRSRNQPTFKVIGGQINGKRTPTARRDDIAATA